MNCQTPFPPMDQREPWWKRAFVRRHPAHPSPVERHSRPAILHVSVCTGPRREILAAAAAHEALCSAWSEAVHWCVGFYVIMPDHVHLFCAPARWNCDSVKQWVTFWKRRAARALPMLKQCWEPDYWDTQMRTQGHYLRKLDYVRDNPVREGLVSRREAWPYQGNMTDLRWL